jgi:arylsulfatase/uncharacterized sulfatase
LIAHLKAIGAYENIIFVFLSDNGAESTDPMNMGACKRLQEPFVCQVKRLG